ncbi:thiamine pyrophosphate-binding protein [Gammaproteobacteria bacterium]|nr:thiamine pyrophosphate-binding protein [Gammaproteobacteria bacterium]
MKYSDFVAKQLVELGYTHCFFLAGGNIMHLLESFSRCMECIPVAHENTGIIAAEYLNSLPGDTKAIALVTAGPGITNSLTGISGANLESRELLVIGGTVKTIDISSEKLRQRGIQEINGQDTVKPLAKFSERIMEVKNGDYWSNISKISSSDRKGVAFIEFPIDLQSKEVDFKIVENKNLYESSIKNLDKEIDLSGLANEFKKAFRVSFLIGGGCSKEISIEIIDFARKCNIPIFTTYNGMDRIDSSHPNYFGRPNTWGQRYSNILFQQSDLVIVFGSRLGLQQTGFNHKEFVPVGKVCQIDIDENELTKGHPVVDFPICSDVGMFCHSFFKLFNKNSKIKISEAHEEWMNFCKMVKDELPLNEESSPEKGRITPHLFFEKISEASSSNDIIIPCSSGGAFTCFYQMFNQKNGQDIRSNKSLASMGYGTSGAIGASFSNRNRKVIHIEGDGGFIQNISALSTISHHNLNIKTFIINDGGYASIRMTQGNYFNGNYIGCDPETGLFFPEWEMLFKSFNIKYDELVTENDLNKIPNLINNQGPMVIIISIHPYQTYMPKISSRITDTGMESNPLHLMTPDLEENIKHKVFKYISV